MAQQSLGTATTSGDSSGGATGTTGSSATGSGATGSGLGSAAAAPSGGTISTYSRCLQAAGTDVTKMQGCAKLLNGQ